MKIYALLAFTCIAASTACAQHTELSLQANTGLFSFGGESAERVSFIYNTRTNNPYGKGSGLSYGLAAELKKATRRNQILGIQLGYESLASNIKINEIIIDDMIIEEQGNTVLRNQFINVHPFFGKRFNAKYLPFDVTIGAEFGFGLKSEEKLSVESFDLETSHDHPIPDLDFRLRIGLATRIKQLGFQAGYSHGLTNYTAEMEGADRENYSRMIRLGISYTLKRSK
ncbi:outer membrane beta-barrel protein [Pedobacter sp. SYSU D00535]|uniref:outer membrane beta-barrel protein n=1 Tax=Pedobacter sp. SYSU D00535 TaxID=2810308 RepID=UPI001A9678DE|nr:outer membrane beta-barrel protein [Pedobacter sp. SYSU D00535]